MDTKAAFEKHMLEVEKIIIGSSDPYPAGLEKTYWRIWQASREAIAIPSSSDSEYWFEGTFQHMRYERDVEKAITSHGIRIKGKTE